MSRPQEAPDSALEMNREWKYLRGKKVHVRMQGAPIDSGRVDAVTNDGGVLWLEAYGAISRRLFVKAEGYEVWSEPELPVNRLGFDAAIFFEKDSDCAQAVSYGSP